MRIDKSVDVVMQVGHAAKKMMFDGLGQDGEMGIRLVGETKQNLFRDGEMEEGRRVGEAGGWERKMVGKLKHLELVFKKRDEVVRLRGKGERNKTRGNGERMAVERNDLETSEEVLWKGSDGEKG